MTGEVVLAVNAGSSSIKFAVYDAVRLERLAGGLVDHIGTPECDLRCSGATGDTLLSLGSQDYESCFGAIATLVTELFGRDAVAACSHRIVHGGESHAGPVVVDAGIMAKLEQLSHLAPLHQPNNLAGLRGMSGAFPGVPQVACFDTAFHRDHPRVAEVYALPATMTAAGIRRYGFHGLSYEYIAAALSADHPDVAKGRVIVAHLGSGASLCAMSDGRSIETTMGFTALDGLPMSTRTGQVDPGVVFHLARGGMTLEAIERAFYRDSGLKGLSGTSGDMRVLAAAGTEEAAFAIDYFCHRVAREMGALAISLGGLDALVFTAGVGEHQPDIRADICKRLGLLGIALDEAANRRNESDLTAPGNGPRILRIPTDEELMLARHAVGLTRGG